MAKPFSHIKVFIASPSDCIEETKICREAIRHVNIDVAHTQRCQLDPYRWEDEAPGACRPQDIFNSHVKECDWALFFLNQRWGTPTGEYTSGFHEEFCLARDRYRRDKTPHIALFFRDVPAGIVADPGEQLQKNLAFRDEIFASQEFLVKTYSAPEDLPDILRRYLSKWVLDGQFIVESGSEQVAELQKQIEQLEEEIAKRDKATTVDLRSAIDLLAGAKPSQAESSLRRQLETESADPEVIGALASSLYAQGRYDESLKILNRSLKIRIDDPGILNNKAIVLEKLGRSEEALDCYNRALKIRPDYPDTLYNKGILLKDFGRNEESLACYNRALKIRPDDPDTLYSKGNILKQLDRFDEALASYNRALKIRPDDPDTLTNKGNILQILGRSEEALDCFNRSLKIRPDDPVTLMNRGIFLFYNKDFDQARIDLTNAAEISHEVKHWLNVCCLEIAVANISAASEALSAALTADVQNEPEASVEWFRAAVAALEGDNSAIDLEHIVATVAPEGARADRRFSDMYTTLDDKLSKESADVLKSAAELI